MRLFITSYQKSGTHQIMPMFVVIPDVVDRGHNQYIDVPERFGVNREINWEGVKETVESLRVFRNKSEKAFGHIAYMPEYAQVLKETNTKVLFNTRDPRDIVIAEYENGMRHLRADPQFPPLWDFFDKEAGKRIFKKQDPITDLIILAGARWPHWLGWLEHDFVKQVKYENLRLRPKETIEELIDWLDGFGCSTVDTMMRNALPGPKSPTFRKGAPGEWAEKFKPHHTKLAKELLTDVMNKLGYTW